VQFLADLASTIRALRSAGKRVILGMPFPTYMTDIPNYEIRHAGMGAFFPFRPELRPDTWRPALLQIAISEHANIYDPRLTLCPQQTCIYQVDGVSTMLDSAHIAQSLTSTIRPGLLNSLMLPSSSVGR